MIPEAGAALDEPVQGLEEHDDQATLELVDADIKQENHILKYPPGHGRDQAYWRWCKRIENEGAVIQRELVGLEAERQELKDRLGRIDEWIGGLEDDLARETRYARLTLAFAMQGDEILKHRTRKTGTLKPSKVGSFVLDSTRKGGSAASIDVPEGEEAALYAQFPECVKLDVVKTALKKRVAIQGEDIVELDPETGEPIIDRETGEVKVVADLGLEIIEATAKDTVYQLKLPSGTTVELERRRVGAGEDG